MRVRPHTRAAGAREVDDIFGPIGGFSQSSLQPPPTAALHAMLAGDTCTCAGISTSGPAPALALCRALCAAGHDPRLVLEVYRGSALAFTVRSLGEGAQFTIDDDKSGTPRLRRWRARGVARAHSS